MQRLVKWLAILVVVALVAISAPAVARAEQRPNLGSLKVSALVATPGQLVTLTAQLRTKVRRPVVLELRSGNSWKPVARKRTSRKGRISIATRHPATGRVAEYRVTAKAFRSGGSTLAAGRTNAVTIKTASPVTTPTPTATPTPNPTPTPSATPTTEPTVSATPTPSPDPSVGAPTVTTLVPATGTAMGGETVTLTGTALGNVTEVRFGGQAAAELHVLSDSSLTVVSPFGYPGNAEVALVVGATQHELDTGRTFTYASPSTSGALLSVPKAEALVIEGASVLMAERLAPDRSRLVVTMTDAPVIGQQVVVQPGGTALQGGIAGSIDTADPSGSDTWTIELIEGSLDESFDQLSIHSSGPIDMEASRFSMRYRREGGTRVRSGDTVRTLARDSVDGGKSLFTCKDKDGNDATDVVGSLDVKLDFENTHHAFDLEKGDAFTEPYINVGLWTEPVVSISGSFGAAATCKLSPAITDKFFPAVPVLGPLTMDIGPYLEFSVSAKGTIALERRLYRGFSYIKSGDNPGHESISHSADDPKVTGGITGTVTVSAGGFFELAAWDRVGVQAKIGVYVDAGFTFVPSPPAVTCAIEFGFEASASLFLDVWVTRWDFTFASVQIPIVTWRACQADPSGGISADPEIRGDLWPVATDGDAYSHRIRTMDDREGRWQASGLPSGIVLDGNSGVVSGTPTVRGSFDIEVTFIDGLGRRVVRTFDLLIEGTTTLLRDGLVVRNAPHGTAAPAAMNEYVDQLTIDGNAPASGSWDMVGGSLPPGLALAPSGSLTGRPTTRGTFEFAAEHISASDVRTRRIFEIGVTGLDVGPNCDSGIVAAVLWDDSTPPASHTNHSHQLKIVAGGRTTFDSVVPAGQGGGWYSSNDIGRGVPYTLTVTLDGFEFSQQFTCG